jgi:predicted ATP-grasp superfamily ATP-dependent carboligase
MLASLRILIVESGFTRGALAGCRALARSGWTVGVGSPTKGGLAASSRYAHRWHDVPLVQDDLDAFLDATERAVTEQGYEAVFCCEDAQALALSFGRDRISAVVPYPPHAVVLRGIDKLELAHAAQRVGMATPETVLADEVAISSARLPMMVKSRLHWTPGAQRAPARLEASVCCDRDAIKRQVEAIRGHGGDSVLQQFVSGRLVHFIVVVDAESEVVAAVQTLAEPLFYPGPDIGQRIRSVSVRVDEGLRARVGALMRELEWVGLASLNLLLPEGGGEPTLIDFNARYPASFDQYIAAGPNFPVICACLATGRPLPPPVPVKAGVRFQWLEGDLNRALRQRRGGLLNDVSDCLRYAPGAVHTLWRRDDPLPAVRLGGVYARRTFEKIWRFVGGHRRGGPSRGGPTGAAPRTVSPEPRLIAPPSTNATTPPSTPTS